MSLTIEPDAAARPATSPNQTSPVFARRVLLEAVFLGCLADALLHQGFGLGLLIWLAVFAAMLVHLARTRGDSLTWEQLAWLGTAVLFGGALAWRDSMPLQVYDFLAMLAALALLGATLARGSVMHSILGQRLRDVIKSLGDVAGQVGFGTPALVFGESALGAAVQSWRGSRATAVARASLIGLPLLVVFGLLFASADPVFSSLLSLPKLDWDVIVSHLFLAGFFTWVVGGWLRGALVDTRPRTRLGSNIALSLGTLELTVVLGGLVALFALFVGVQIGWLFGGERLVKSATGLSYAQYARHGFFELVWVSLLVLPVLLGTRAAIRDDDASAVRRHRQLSLALLVLLGGVMVSALSRMALYVQYYGLTIDRLSATVFMIWLAIVFVWFGLTVLRGRTRDFAAGMAITGFMTLAALNLTDPEALVARENVSRAPSAPAVADSGSTRTPIDYTYLTRGLHGDAVEVTVRALLAPPVSATSSPARDAEVRERCKAVRNLLKRWGEGSNNSAGWRTWNFGAWRARRAVRDHEIGLRRVTCRDAAGEAPFGDRDSREARPGEQSYAAPPASGLPGGGGTQ